MTHTAIDQFSGIVKRAFNQFIRERVHDRLKTALHVEQEEAQEAETEFNDEMETIKKRGIVTTLEETEGFNIVKAIVREVIDVKRINMRDTKSYCGILLDDNNRKPICRLLFNNPSNKRISLFTHDAEERVSIDDVDDIFKYADRLKSTVIGYLESPNNNHLSETK